MEHGEWEPLPLFGTGWSALTGESARPHLIEMTDDEPIAEGAFALCERFDGPIRLVPTDALDPSRSVADSS